VLLLPPLPVGVPLRDDKAGVINDNGSRSPPLPPLLPPPLALSFKIDSINKFARPFGTGYMYVSRNICGVNGVDAAPRIILARVAGGMTASPPFLDDWQFISSIALSNSDSFSGVVSSVDLLFLLQPF
jgi:hypothetical protein